MIDTMLNMEWVTLISFVGAGLLLNITPGVDFLFITASGLRGGPHIGRVAGLGVITGVAVHVIAAALGVSALLIAYPSAYETIKFLGIIYLLYIAFQAWIATDELGESKPALTVSQAFGRGFLTNVLNPKTALFIFAFIPQFTDPTVGPIWHQILILGAIFFFNGFLFALALGTLAGHLGPALRSRVGILNKITAVLFVGLAAKLVLD